MKVCVTLRILSSVQDSLERKTQKGRERRRRERTQVGGEEVVRVLDLSLSLFLAPFTFPSKSID
jgi:hypothetical protein